MRRYPGAIALLLAALAAASSRATDTAARLTADRLEAVHQAAERLRGERKAPERLSELADYRANLHIHSALSHDSRGKIDEIVAAAKRAGTRVLLFTEHPDSHYDFVRDGHQGLKDGVLLVPGAETKGLLVFPKQSLGGVDAGDAQALSDLVRGRGGLTFLSHLEERMDWELRGLTGAEIYNTHAVVKGDRKLAAALRDPFWLLGAAGLFGKYPQEAFSALHDYPADYLRRYDELCALRPHTGIAANDAHQNLGLSIRLVDAQTARLETALGEKIADLNADLIAAIHPFPKGAKPGDTVFQLLLDPYECSLRHVGTHLLMKELTTDAVWQALEQGRAFVAFDWMADATGFDLVAEVGGQRYPLGSRVKFASETRLLGRSPLPGHWKILRGGKVVAEATGCEFTATLTEPGIYRAELWLDLAGEERIWVLTNPIYLQP